MNGQDTQLMGKDSDRTPVLLVDRLTAHSSFFQEGMERTYTAHSEEQSKNSLGGHQGWRVADVTLVPFSRGVRGWEKSKEELELRGRTKAEELQKLLEPWWIHCCLDVHTAVQILYMNAVSGWVCLSNPLLHLQHLHKTRHWGSIKLAKLNPARRTFSVL